MTNLDSILKSRDVTLLIKDHLVKAMVFLVVMYEYESWTIMKAGCWRIDAFELWCWRRLLWVPWTARRSNQSPVNTKGNQSWIFTGAEAEAPILWPPNAKSWLIGKDPMLGKIEGRRRRGWQRMRWLDGIPDMSLSKLWGLVMARNSRSAAVHGVTKSWIQLSNWTKLNWVFYCIHVSHHLYPFIHWWTFRLFPYLGYCK